MFCTKCGKELYPGDRFCANCGAEVRQARPTVYDDIVFNPPFKEEARKRTEEIAGTFVGFKSEPVEKETPKPKVEREPVQFDWGMDDKPKPKKIQEASFDWSQVVQEKKRQSRGISVEQIDQKNHRLFVKEEPKPEPVVVGFSQPQLTLSYETEEEPMSIEDLEREIFGNEEERGRESEAQKEPEFLDDRFKTFNEKNAQLDLLIQKEKEHLESMGITVSKETEEKVSENLESRMESRVVGFSQPERTIAVEPVGKYDNLTKKDDDSTKIMPAITETDVPKAVIVPDVLPEIAPAEIEKAETPKAEEPEEVKEEPRFREFKPDFMKNETFEKASYFEMSDPVVPEIDDILKEAEEEKKLKLRYSDVFPRVPVDEFGNPVENAENYEPVPDMVVKHEAIVPQIIAQNKQRKEEQAKEDSKIEPTYYNKRPERKAEEKRDLTGIFDAIEIEEDEPKKKHIFARIIIGFLVFLIICEGIILAVKFLAPDSKFSNWISEKTVQVISLVSGGKIDKPVISSGNDDNGDDVNVPDSGDSYMQQLIMDAAGDVKKIGEVGYDQELSYDGLSSYAFAETEKASEFIDEDWFEDKNGDMVTYGEVLMSTVVNYFEGWQDINQDANLVGINSLEIGETRIGETGFYTLARVTYAGADGSEIVKYQTVYTRVSDKSIVINMVKEESI